MLERPETCRSPGVGRRKCQPERGIHFRPDTPRVRREVAQMMERPDSTQGATFDAFTATAASSRATDCFWQRLPSVSTPAAPGGCFRRSHTCSSAAAWPPSISAATAMTANFMADWRWQVRALCVARDFVLRFLFAGLAAWQLSSQQCRLRSRKVVFVRPKLADTEERRKVKRSAAVRVQPCVPLLEDGLRSLPTLLAAVMGAPAGLGHFLCVASLLLQLHISASAPSQNSSQLQRGAPRAQRNATSIDLHLLSSFPDVFSRFPDAVCNDGSPGARGSSSSLVCHPHPLELRVLSSSLVTLTSCSLKHRGNQQTDMSDRYVPSSAQTGGFYLANATDKAKDHVWLVYLQARGFEATARAPTPPTHRPSHPPHPPRPTRYPAPYPVRRVAIGASPPRPAPSARNPRPR